jgi:Raf kinase inhibitor-like YbhB/YbcL family protein
VPSGTVELALTLTDPDANNYVHWVMAKIDPSVQAISEGTVPDGVVQGTNGMNKVGWTGPCPPKGSPHHYVFTLYALTKPSGLTNGMSGKSAVSTLMQSKAPTATLVGTYQRAS